MSKYNVGDPVQVIDRTAGEYLKTGVVVTPDHEATSALVIGFGQYNKTYLRGQIKHADQPALDVVSHPLHYTDGTPPGIEVIDIIRAHEAAGGTWETLNAVKYILRHTLKDNPVQDIKKAIQYLNMWLENQEAA